MKKILYFLMVLLVMAACEKKSSVEEQQADKWNGYDKYLKCGEKTQNLRDNQKNIIGTVKSGFDNNANFYVKYECNNGFTLTKTESFAGSKKDMPQSKPNDPKEDHFCNKQDHDGNTNCTTHYTPCQHLPPAGDPGFTYAAHCRFRDQNGFEHEGWADCCKKFHDKGCGSYDDDYNDTTNQFTTLYGTSYSNDSLLVYRLDITNSTTTLIMQEYVGNTAGRYDGAAFDLTSGMFFFANYDTKELWVNNLKDDSPSFSAGVLDGTAASGTFSENAYYYINEDLNTISKVTFTSSWAIAAEAILDTIPSSIVVYDIAMNPDGDVLYILGEVNGGSKELISWDMATETFYSMSIAIASGAQIAFGSDGVLYAIAPIVEGGTHSLTYIVDTSTGNLTPIEDDVIIIEDPFSDIATGPMM